MLIIDSLASLKSHVWSQPKYDPAVQRVQVTFPLVLHLLIATQTPSHSASGGVFLNAAIRSSMTWLG